MTNEQEKFDIINIELIKKSGKGLGKDALIPRFRWHSTNCAFLFRFQHYRTTAWLRRFYLSYRKKNRSRQNKLIVVVGFLARRRMCRKRWSINVGWSDSRSQWTRSSYRCLRTCCLYIEGTVDGDVRWSTRLTFQTLPHGRVTIKIGRLKPSARLQTRQNSLPNDRKNRSRSSSSNIRRSSANKVNERWSLQR